MANLPSKYSATCQFAGSCSLVSPFTSIGDHIFVCLYSLARHRDVSDIDEGVHICTAQHTNLILFLSLHS